MKGSFWASKIFSFFGDGVGDLPCMSNEGDEDQGPLPFWTKWGTSWTPEEFIKEAKQSRKDIQMHEGI